MRRKIYLFGDSLTEESFGAGGWGASLTNHFSRSADVVLRGYSGFNTRWARKVFDRVFPPVNDAAYGGDPVAVTVFFGANDACLPDRFRAYQHVPIDEYKLNLHFIVSSLQDYGFKKKVVFLQLEGFKDVKKYIRHQFILKDQYEDIDYLEQQRLSHVIFSYGVSDFKKRWPSTHILLITPPPIDEAARLLHQDEDNTLGLPERTNEAADAYADACVSVARECGIPVVNLWAKMQQFPGWHKGFLSDGLHLTQEGNQFVFQEVIAMLKTGLSLESLPFDLPLYHEIDPADPLKAFEQY